MADVIGGQTWQVLTKCLGVADLRQQVIAHNIANLNVPGFKKSHVEFEGALRNALDNSIPDLDRTNPRHMSSRFQLGEIEPQVVRDGGSNRPDRNNVDLNEQMVELAKNSFYYQVVEQAISGRLANMRYVLTDGRK